MKKVAQRQEKYDRWWLFPKKNFQRCEKTNTHRSPSHAGPWQLTNFSAILHSAILHYVDYTTPYTVFLTYLSGIRGSWFFCDFLTFFSFKNETKKIEKWVEWIFIELCARTRLGTWSEPLVLGGRLKWAYRAAHIQVAPSLTRWAHSAFPSLVLSR